MVHSLIQSPTITPTSHFARGQNGSLAVCKSARRAGYTNSAFVVYAIRCRAVGAMDTVHGRHDVACVLAVSKGKS
jgi:hypothetical protein